MKTLVKWFLKYTITNKLIKEFVHGMNTDFAEKVKLDGKQKVIGIANDISSCTATRLNGFKDDGRIDANELEAINAHDDTIIDKYFPDDKIRELIDKVMG